MRSLPLLVLLLAGCSRPYYAQKNGDLDIAIAKKQANCEAVPSRACELIDEFADADEALPTPSKRDRYLGWLSPSGKSPDGVIVSMIVDSDDNRMKALILPLRRFGTEDAKDVKAFLKKGADDGSYNAFFETRDEPSRIWAIEGTKTHELHGMGFTTFVRRKGKRILIVQMGSTKTTDLTWGHTTAVVWAGELRKLD